MIIIKAFIAKVIFKASITFYNKVIMIIQKHYIVTLYCNIKLKLCM